MPLFLKFVTGSINKFFNAELGSSNPQTRVLELLFLEKFLWPFYSAHCNDFNIRRYHLLFIVKSKLTNNFSNIVFVGFSVWDRYFPEKLCQKTAQIFISVTKLEQVSCVQLQNPKMAAMKCLI